jgi:DNA repair photolyase
MKSATLSKVSRLSSRRKNRSLAFAPEQVWVDRSVADHPQTIRILNKLPDARIDIADDVRRMKRPGDLSSAKRQMILTAHQGSAFKPCQGIGDNHLCCNYHVIDLISGCPMDCSYCILQSYLANNPITTVYVNIEEILGQVSTLLRENPRRNFRIGTGELSDSLALDQITDFASVLIPFFASKNNAVLELKTKTNMVDHLLDIRHGGRTVIGWSVNTPEVIASDEVSVANLDERLAAAAKVASAGYRVAFHFDPIIVNRGDRDEIAAYEGVIDRIFQTVEPSKIAWVSLGLLRYPSDLPAIARKRFPQTSIYNGELVGAGNKVRYPRFIRQEVYKPLWEKLTSKLAPRKVYLCMETKSVWGRIDPSVEENSCIEKRLCNVDINPFMS